eukprot:6710618-Prymnesium_polylepis.1
MRALAERAPLLAGKPLVRPRAPVVLAPSVQRVLPFLQLVGDLRARVVRGVRKDGVLEADLRQIEF